MGMELDELVRRLAGPFIAQQREDSVWVAKCCGKAMASVTRPAKCGTCGQPLQAQVLSKSDFPEP